MAAIGNQWSINKFTIGCDWIGIAQPLATNIDESFTAAADQIDRDNTRADENRYLKQTVAIVTRFYLGMSF
jgi:hypothetical protein